MVKVRMLVAGLLASTATAPALAADAGQYPVYTAPPPANHSTSSFDWNGPYLGLIGGYGWGDYDSGPDMDGLAGGVYAGFNHQFGKGVLGFEMDGLFSGIDGASGGTSADVDWLSTARLRAGRAEDNFLFYGTGGLALAGGKLSAGGTSDRETHLGWALGAGVEAGLSERMTGRLEYQYSNFGDKTYSTGPTNTGFDIHSLRVGLGFKF